jgi:polysaccharide biosynthesis protein PelG
MAGIGFALRKLARQDSLLSGLRAYSHAAVISCGPWLFTVLALGGIELIGHSIVPILDLQRFSSIVRYDFCFSLIAAGPIALVLTRQLADQIYAKNVTDATSLFCCCSACRQSPASFSLASSLICRSPSV